MPWNSLTSVLSNSPPHHRVVAVVPHRLLCPIWTDFLILSEINAMVRSNCWHGWSAAPFRIVISKQKEIKGVLFRVGKRKLVLPFLQDSCTSSMNEMHSLSDKNTHLMYHFLLSINQWSIYQKSSKSCLLFTTTSQLSQSSVTTVTSFSITLAMFQSPWARCHLHQS